MSRISGAMCATCICLGLTPPDPRVLYKPPHRAVSQPHPLCLLFIPSFFPNTNKHIMSDVSVSSPATHLSNHHSFLTSSRTR